MYETLPVLAAIFLNSKATRTLNGTELRTNSETWLGKPDKVG